MPILALQPMDLLQPLDLERKDSEEEEDKEEEEEATLLVIVEVRVEASDEQSPSYIVAGS